MCFLYIAAFFLTRRICVDLYFVSQFRFKLSVQYNRNAVKVIFPATAIEVDIFLFQNILLHILKYPLRSNGSQGYRLIAFSQWVFLIKNKIRILDWNDHLAENSSVSYQHYCFITMDVDTSLLTSAVVCTISIVICSVLRFCILNENKDI